MVRCPAIRHSSSGSAVGAHATETRSKRGMHEKVIDMPVGRSDALLLHPDVTGDPGETTRSLCRTGIHMPAASERQGTKGANLHDTACGSAAPGSRPLYAYPLFRS